MQSAEYTLGRAQSKACDLQSMLQILASDPIEHTELISQAQDDIRIEERRVSFEQFTLEEAKKEVTRLQTLLVAASRLNPSICPIVKPHSYHAARPASFGQRENIKHRFWIVTRPQKQSSRRVGPYRYKLENHRVMAFYDIQESTNSAFGNGHSGLCTAITNGYEASHVDLTGFSNQENSWILLHMRFKARRDDYIKFCLWCSSLEEFHSELLASPLLLLAPPPSVPTTLSKKAMKGQYAAAVRFRQLDSYWRWE
jgi:hypothetical protein